MFRDRLSLTVQTEAFEGPLDLLLFLIQKKELSLSRITLSEITTPYLESLQWMQAQQLEVASEFLVLASTLLYWKSRSLLPESELASSEEVQEGKETAFESPEALLKQLWTHALWMEAGRALGNRDLEGRDVFGRPPSPLAPPLKQWKTLDPTQLGWQYQTLCRRAEQRTRVLQKETVSIEEKMKWIQASLPLGQGVSFQKWCWGETVPGRSEQVAFFLAVLELSRLQILSVFQAEAGKGDFYLERRTESPPPSE